MSEARKSRRAQVDVLEIWVFIAEFDSAAADAMIHRFDGKLQLLADSPGIGSPRPGLGSDVRSVVVDPYLMLYRPIADGVELIRVIHGARDLGTAFRS